MALASDYLQTVIIPDTQYPWVDKAAEAAVMEYVKAEQPNQIIQLGDFLDLNSLATFRQELPPGERIYLRQEIEIGRERLKAWSALAPKARKILIEGNHEERLSRYLADNGGELADLASDGLNIPSLLGAKEAGWEYVGPYGAGIWVGFEGGLWATHGEIVRKWSADSAQANVIEKYGHSVIHGHTHRLGSFYHTLQGRTLAGFEAGCLCDFNRTPRGTTVVNWQHGFAVVWTSKKSLRFHVDLIAITDGGFVYGGRKYGR